MWQRERTIRVTASTVGSLLKMRTTTKPSKTVETMLYSGFKGSQATRYGTVMEQVSRREYKTYQERRGHSITTFQTGLVISLNHPWLAASPDDRVFDPTATPQSGLADYKNPYSVRDKTLEEAGKILSFCLEKKENGYRLKRRHDYYYQVQCQLYCDDKSWCDFMSRNARTRSQLLSVYYNLTLCHARLLNVLSSMGIKIHRSQATKQGQKYKMRRFSHEK